MFNEVWKNKNYQKILEKLSKSFGEQGLTLLVIKLCYKALQWNSSVSAWIDKPNNKIDFLNPEIDQIAYGNLLYNKDISNQWEKTYVIGYENWITMWKKTNFLFIPHIAHQNTF